MADGTPVKPGEFATVIGADARFKGELSFDGGVRIDGRFEGSITTSGQVLISKGGQVQADIQARHLVLEGHMTGNLTAQDMVELRATADLQGDVRAAKLVVIEGATLVGRCEVGPNVKKGAAPVGRNGDAPATATAKPVAAAAAK